MTIPPTSAAMGEAPPHLERRLSSRHVQLGIGGAIGTGLFIGFMLFFVMRAMGELLLSNLHYKSFSDFAAGQRIWPAPRRTAPT